MLLCIRKLKRPQLFLKLYDNPSFNLLPLGLLSVSVGDTQMGSFIHV